MATFRDGGAEATADPQHVSFELEKSGNSWQISSLGGSS